MTKLCKFEIAFGTIPAVFMPGQLVTGVVTVNLTDKMKMRGIRLQFEGRSKVEWIETNDTAAPDSAFGEEGGGGGESADNPSITEIFQNGRLHFQHEITLFGRDKNTKGFLNIMDENPSLEAGTASYPFQFHLPPEIPTSFEGPYGFVRYSCRAEIDRPWKSNHVTSAAFTVFNHFDLNAVAAANQPKTINDERIFGSLCCKSGPVETSLCLPECSGFVPGERIPISGTIVNQSNKTILSWTVSLIQETKYFASQDGKGKNRHEKVDIYHLAKYTSTETNKTDDQTKSPRGTDKTHDINKDNNDNEDAAPILPGQVRNIFCSLAVPPVSPSDLRLPEAFISIQYKVKLRVKFKQGIGLTDDMVTAAHVLVGTVPLFSQWNRIIGVPPPPPPPPPPVNAEAIATAPPPPSPPPAYYCSEKPGPPDFFDAADDDQMPSSAAAAAAAAASGLDVAVAGAKAGTGATASAGATAGEGATTAPPLISFPYPGVPAPSFLPGDIPGNFYYDDELVNTKKSEIRIERFRPYYPSFQVRD